MQLNDLRRSEFRANRKRVGRGNSSGNGTAAAVWSALPLWWR